MKKSILLSASLFHALNDASTVTLPMIFPLLYSQNMMIGSYSQIGILSNLGLLVTFIGQFIVTRWEHRFEYKYQFLFSITGISLLLFSLTFVRSFTLLLMLYLIMRFFVSFYHPIGISWVSRSYSGDGMDFAMGIQSGSGNLGVFIAFISVGYLAQSFGWTFPLRIWSAACLVVGLLAFLIVRKTKTKQRTFSEKIEWVQWTGTLREIKEFIPGIAFGGACWGTTIFYAPSLFNHKFDVPLGKTGIILALWILLGTIVTYCFGLLSRRFGRWNVCRLGLAGAAFSLLGLGMTNDRFTALVCLFLFGGFLFLTYPAFQSFVGSRTSESNQTIAFCHVAGLQMISGAMVALISGFLSDSFGISSPFLFLALLGMGTAFFYQFKRKIIKLSEPHRPA
ncbi:MAG: MFS transporter [Acidobacteria bacterium]|nr:MFS transporter [Acidobacteriota bacterium]